MASRPKPKRPECDDIRLVERRIGQADRFTQRSKPAHAVLDLGKELKDRSSRRPWLADACMESPTRCGRRAQSVNQKSFIKASSLLLATSHPDPKAIRHSQVRNGEHLGGRGAGSIRKALSWSPCLSEGVLFLSDAAVSVCQSLDPRVVRLYSSLTNRACVVLSGFSSPFGIFHQAVKAHYTVFKGGTCWSFVANGMKLDTTSWGDLNSRWKVGLFTITRTFHVASPHRPNRKAGLRPRAKLPKSSRLHMGLSSRFLKRPRQQERRLVAVWHQSGD